MKLHLSGTIKGKAEVPSWGLKKTGNWKGEYWINGKAIEGEEPLLRRAVTNLSLLPTGFAVGGGSSKVSLTATFTGSVAVYP